MTAYSYERGNSLLNEDSTKKKKDKKKKNKKQELQGVNPNLIDKYNGLETKSNINNSLIKSLVDVVAAGLVGPALSATLGKYSPIAGIALSFGGHYTGEQSGLMRGIGMSTIAHAVAKSNEYRDSNSTLQNRLSELKDDWLRMIFLGNSEQKQLNIDGIEQPVVIEQSTEIPTPLEEQENVNSIEDDLAAFDLKTQSFLEDQAEEFDYEKSMEQRFEQETSDGQSDSNPFDWEMDDWERSNTFNQFEEPRKEVDFPDDLDFSEL